MSSAELCLQVSIMTTYIQQVVTDVSVDAETPEDAREVDRRWEQERKVLAALKSRQVLEQRIASEGFDD